MGIDSKYGIITTQYGHINEGEPVFILRAQDASTVSTLKHYRDLCADLGVNPDTLRDIDSNIKDFQNWRKKKLPD